MVKEIRNEKSSVIYSFEGRWEEALRRREVRVFFRKKRPVILPNRIFIYIGVPVKAIIGSAKVESINSVTLKEAILIRDDGAITENELKKYIGDRAIIHAIRINSIDIFPKTFSLDALHRDFNFTPPQSFSMMSIEIQEAIFGHLK